MWFNSVYLVSARIKFRVKVVTAPSVSADPISSEHFLDSISRSVMNGASPAHSLVSTTAVAGGGGSSGAAAGLDDFHFPPDIPSMQERKDEAMRVLKADLMAELDKEVKSLEEDSWMFEGPRSRIHLISRRGNFLKKEGEAIVKSSIVQLPR